MSLSYTHLLIPESPEYRPRSEAVADFARGIVEHYLGKSAHASFSPVTKGDSKVRKMVNPISGETLQFNGPPRSREKPLVFSTVPELVTLAESYPEYDLSIVPSDSPIRPPLLIGYVESDQWQPMEGNYHLEIRLRIRSTSVFISRFKSEQDVDRPLDFKNLPSPRFDEDCTTSATKGVFVHPESGPFTLPYGGCGRFWIEFNYGKSIFPRLVDESVRILDDETLTFAQETFAIAFVQACNWG